MSRTETEQRLVAAARQKCHILYAGTLTGHRSCGIALAETFGVPTPSYQSLRRGGLTGEGPCGAIMAGRLILGEMLGDPDPTGPTTPELSAAMAAYESQWKETIELGGATDIICNTLTGRFPIFRSAARHGFCTDLATEVATVLATVLIQHGVAFNVTNIDGVPSFDPEKPKHV